MMLREMGNDRLPSAVTFGTFQGLASCSFLRRARGDEGLGSRLCPEQTGRNGLKASVSAPTTFARWAYPRCWEQTSAGKTIASTVPTLSS